MFETKMQIPQKNQTTVQTLRVQCLNSLTQCKYEVLCRLHPAYHTLCSHSTSIMIAMTLGSDMPH
jgi:hypothetical protein